MRSAFLRSAAVLATGVAAVSVGLPAAPAAILPDWSLVGDHDVSFQTGIHDMEGDYSIALEGYTIPVRLDYQTDGSLSGGGGFEGPGGNFNFFTVTGRVVREPDGTERFTIAEIGKRPRFRFTGVVTGGGGDVVGTYERDAGFGGLPGDVSGDLTFTRVTPRTGNGAFRLRMKTTMDSKGRVKGRLGGLDGKTEERARIDLFGGGRLDDGRVKGLVKTTKDGLTTATVKIKGPGWTTTLTGPVDASGFHALADVRGGGFAVDDAPLTLVVVEGPEPPPPPPPPPPKNQLTEATATFSGGQIEIRRGAVPKKFFGARADLTVRFPSTFTSGTLVADPTTATAMNPARLLAALGSTVYETGNTGASVTFTMQKYTSVVGQTIEVLCRGEVFTASGKKKTVDVLVVAVVE